MTHTQFTVWPQPADDSFRQKLKTKLLPITVKGAGSSTGLSSVMRQVEAAQLKDRSYSIDMFGLIY